MVLPPNTTPAPKPSSLFLPGMSSSEPPSSEATAAPPPAETPLPSRPKYPVDQPQQQQQQRDKNTGDPAAASHADAEADDHDRLPEFDLPRLRLEIRDLNHPAATYFLSAVNASTALATAVRSVLRLLYGSPSCPTTHAPPTRSVTLVLRNMGGVAYTTGTDLDDDHKEIHFSLPYIAGIPAARHADEIMGVLTHEMVHCFQWNALGTCPGGLVEGIADWVRLNSRLVPPHWKRDATGEWDAGYQHTAYFLEYLEGRFGAGTVRGLNERLRKHHYREKEFWTQSLGRPVEQLWKDYAEKLKDEEAVIVNKDDISDDDVRLGRIRVADEAVL